MAEIHDKFPCQWYRGEDGNPFTALCWRARRCYAPRELRRKLTSMEMFWNEEKRWSATEIGDIVKQVERSFERNGVMDLHPNDLEVLDSVLPADATKTDRYLFYFWTHELAYGIEADHYENGWAAPKHVVYDAFGKFWGDLLTYLVLQYDLWLYFGNVDEEVSKAEAELMEAEKARDLVAVEVPLWSIEYLELYAPAIDEWVRRFEEWYWKTSADAYAKMMALDDNKSRATWEENRYRKSAVLQWLNEIGGKGLRYRCLEKNPKRNWKVPEGVFRQHADICDEWTAPHVKVMMERTDEPWIPLPYDKVERILPTPDANPLTKAFEEAAKKKEAKHG